MFSSLKLIKTNRRTRLNCDTLDELMEIHVEGPSLERFSAEQAAEPWWEHCKSERRPNQSARKPYVPRKTTQRDTNTPADGESESQLSLSLREWDTWFNDSDNSNDGELFDD